MPRHPFSNTRQRIEEESIKLFAARGISETSVRDITRAVGISEGALYRHFESKEDLVWQAFERNYIAFATELERLAAQPISTKDKIAARDRGLCPAPAREPPR